MPPDSRSPRYALIVGNGRSGTNWLLTMLNASDLTHCRNEPQHISSSPFHSLPAPAAIAAADPEMALRWDAFVRWTVAHLGERDHRIIAPKQYLHKAAHRLGISTWSARPRLRRAIQNVSPEFAQGEWAMPWWMGSQARLEQAYSIFKLNDLPAWIVRWLLKHRRNRPIVHIVRHPGGQLSSGLKRYFSKLEPSAIAAETRLYRGLLKTAVQLEPDWQETIPEIESMSLTEALAWFWRYNNEAIYQTGQGCQNYYYLTYENLARNPIVIAKEVYRFYQIPWTAQAESIISQNTHTSVWGKLPADSKTVAEAWQDRLSDDQQQIVEQVLDGSLMQTWWS